VTSSNTATVSPRLRSLAALALVVWAAGYLLGSILGDDPITRAVRLRLLGSTSPVAAMLEWVGFALTLAVMIAAVAPRLRGRWREVGLSIGSLVVIAVVTEGAFRLYRLARPTTHGYNTYSNELWYARYGKRNSLGFRDVEPTRARVPGRRRILLIGDSFGFANGIDDLGDRFGEQLVEGLKKRGDGDWELLNASLPNTHTLEHERILSRMLPFRPDLVVLLYVFNDAEYLKKPSPSRGMVTLPRDFRRDMMLPAILMRNSYLFQELYLRLHIVPYRRAQQEANIISDAYADSALVTRHLADLSRFVAAARAGGAAVRIVPFDIGVVADERLRRRDEAFIARATGAGLPLCPITTAFDGRAFRTLTVNALDLHPNERANAIAAAAALPCIARALASDSTPGSPAFQP
jgi:hypothetical protein